MLGDWDLANVTPIFKKGSKSAPWNYSLVSFSYIICKVMELLIKDAIEEYLDKNKIIRSSRFTCMSCLTNLLEYIEELTRLVEERLPVDMFLTWWLGHSGPAAG